MSSGRREAPSDGRVAEVRRVLHDAFLTGVGLTIPLIVTLVVLAFVLNFVGDLIRPAIDVLEGAAGLGEDVPTVLLETVTVLTLVLVIFVVGLVAEYRDGDSIDRAFDATMERIPGLGSVYTSFNQMSEMLLENDTHSFQEVYLVEYPTSGSYVVAFLTANTPDFVVDATGEDDLVTLFVPMAPNPVMGGFVVHVSPEQVYDVDMSVEEGIQSIVTSGVAEGGDENDVSASEIIASNAHTD